MNVKKVLGIMFVLFISLFIVACSNESDNESEGTNDAEATEETNDAEANEENGSEEAEENVVPEDEALFAVLEANLEALTENDLDAYMETIHSESPLYDTTRTTIDQLSVYTLDMELFDLVVEEKSEEEATISYKQTTMKVDGPDFMNNETHGVHVLRPDDGAWKIYSSEEPSEIIPLDENGEVIEETAADAAAEGVYIDTITSLEIPFDEGKWELENYEEGDGEATAEFLLVDEDQTNFTELFTIHYYPDGDELLGAEGFIEMMEMNLTEMTTGELEFNSAEEGFFDFSLTEDDIQLDQEEVARVFAKDNDLYVVRYTTFEKSIEDKDEWVDKLKSIQ